MADERYSFTQARTRLEEIVAQVRKKDTSLEKSLDLLEEGVRLANVCTEQSDHTEWRSVVQEQADEQSVPDPDSPEPESDEEADASGEADEDLSADDAAVDSESSDDA